MAMAAKLSITCECCGAKDSVASSENCSCALKPQEHFHECNVVQHIKNQLNLRKKRPDEECFLSVAIFNIGIKNSEEEIKKGNTNQFKAATGMCGRGGNNGTIPFCKVMVINCSLANWATYPDFIILSEALQNVRRKMKEFLPMYDSDIVRTSDVCLCWLKNTWRCTSNTYDHITQQVSILRCHIVALERIYLNDSVQNVTLIGVHARDRANEYDTESITDDVRLHNVTRLRQLISDIPNHGVVIIGGDFNVDINGLPCFMPTNDRILIPSRIRTGESRCIDNIVVAKLECQDEMTVTVTRRDVIDILDHPILDHNPVLGVVSIKNASCSNPAHAETATGKSKGSTHEDDNGQGKAEGSNKKDNQPKSRPTGSDATGVAKTVRQSDLALALFGLDFNVRFNPPPDGNGQFHAVSDLLRKFGIDNITHTELRANVVERIGSKRDSLSDFVTGDFDEYVDRMSRNGEHGDHITLKTMGDLYDANILVITANSTFLARLMFDEYNSRRPCLCVGYEKEGGGQRYVSLQAKDLNTLRNNIEKASGKQLTRPSHDLGTLDTGPSQPILNTYPFNNENVAFSAHWYEYSVSRNAVFCFPCRMFHAEVGGRQQDAYTTRGVSTWPTLNGKLKKHAKTNIHKNCSERLKSHYQSYKKV